MTNKIKEMVAMGSISRFSSTNSAPKKLKEFSLDVTDLTRAGNEEVIDMKTRLQCTLRRSGTEYKTIPGNLNTFILCSTGAVVSLRLLTSRRRKLWLTAFATLSTITLRPEEGFAAVPFITGGKVFTALKHWVLYTHLGLFHSLYLPSRFLLLPTIHRLFSYIRSCHPWVLSWEVMWSERRSESYSYGALRERGL